MLKSRSIFIGIVTLGMLLLVYLLYAKFSNTPAIDIGVVLTAQTNAPAIEFDRQVGQIGDGIGVGSVQKAYFFDLNPKTRELEREFGFSKLFHEEGDIWEIENPYMTVYRSDFVCSITADFGTVLLEKEDRPSPKDATLKGNVIIHIEPDASSGTQPSTLYLDEVLYIGSRSLFSTSGPVYFVNPDAEMRGTGMELIYNQQLGRIEILKIIKLETLKIKTDSEVSLFSSTERERTVSQGDAPAASPIEKTEGVLQDDKVEIKKPEVAEVSADAERYKCILNTNVVIDSPEHIIFADRLVIDNIMPGSSRGDRESKKDEPAESKKTAQTAEQDLVDDEPSRPVVAVASDMPNVIKVPRPEELFTDSDDIILVTCDGGIVFAPVDFALEAAKKSVAASPTVEKALPEKFEDADDYRAKFLADNIYYDFATEKTTAENSIQLLFYHTERAEPDSDEKLKLPVRVSASDKVEFWPRENQVVFEGNCHCKMTRPEPGFLQNYNLSSNKLIIDLEDRRGGDEKSSDTGIKHLRAVGGTVRLSSVKTDGEKQLGGVELKCQQFDYTTANELMVATGPDGMIKVDNSNIAMPAGETQMVALKKPCWAIVQNFNSLQYSSITNELAIRSREHDTLRIDYIPVDPTKDDQHILATANSLDIILTEHSELLSLHAFDGVTYDEQQPLVRENQKGTPIYFEADEFIFESLQSLITAQGTEERPGRINSSPFEVIRYELETGRIIKAKFEGPLIF